MDIDLLSDILAERQPAYQAHLLTSSPDRRLIPASRTQVQEPNAYKSSKQANLSQPGAVISKIEDIFESLVDCILDEKKELVIRLKCRAKLGPQVLHSGSGTVKSTPTTKERTISFPSKTPQEAWKFSRLKSGIGMVSAYSRTAALLRILELSHEALVNGVVITKRDLYYRDPELFIKQDVVDRYVDDIAYTLGIQRSALNVVAAAKGLVVGSFAVRKRDQSVVDYTTEPEGFLVPNTKDIENILLFDVKWILVIEKEATFRTLATSQYWNDSAAGKGVLLTAKGYPDISTRQFLHLLSAQWPNLPILALVDFDPDGIGIMSTYKYGSVALEHESENLVVPKMQWLGVRSHDIVQSDILIQGLLKLTCRDRRIATKMLERDVFQESNESEWRRELQTMLMLNIKAEIQILNNGDGIEVWLNTKLLRYI